METLVVVYFSMISTWYPGYYSKITWYVPRPQSLSRTGLVAALHGNTWKSCSSAVNQIAWFAKKNACLVINNWYSPVECYKINKILLDNRNYYFLDHVTDYCMSLLNVQINTFAGDSIAWKAVITYTSVRPNVISTCGVHVATMVITFTFVYV